MMKDGWMWSVFQPYMVFAVADEIDFGVDEIDFRGQK